jgi:hypothetical protein
LVWGTRRAESNSLGPYEPYVAEYKSVTSHTAYAYSLKFARRDTEWYGEK